MKQIIVFQQRLSSRPLIFPFLVEAFKIYAQDSSASSSHSPADFADDAFQGFFFRTFTKTKKCDTTSALGVGTASALEPMDAGCFLTSPWRSRRRRSPRTSLTLTSRTWSLTGAGGGASGSRLASSIAGGWPRQMGHRPAIRYGGPRGSSAEGQGDWGFVRQWIHGLRQLLGACTVLYFLSTRRGTRILRSSLSCSLVCWSASLAHGEVCTVDTSVAFRAGGRTWKLDIAFTSPLHLTVPVRCLGLLFMAQCLVEQWVHAVRQLLVFLEGFLCEGELVS